MLSWSPEWWTLLSTVDHAELPCFRLPHPDDTRLVSPLNAAVAI